MQTTLTFFDTPTQSWNGTLRGLFASIIIIIICCLWYGLIFKGWKKYMSLTSNIRTYISVFVFVVLFASAICVAQPATEQEAALYGALVGFVIAGTGNAFYLMVNNNYPVSMAIGDTIFGTAVGAFTSWAVYKCFSSSFPSINSNNV